MLLKPRTPGDASSEAAGGPVLRTCLVLGPPRSGTTMVVRLLAGGDGIVSLSEPFLAHAALPNWRLHRIFRRLQRQAGFRRHKPPYPASAERFARFLHDMALENGCRYLAVKETYRPRGLTPHWHNAEVLDRLVATADARVALIRDPYDTAASSVRLCLWVTGLNGWLMRMRLSHVPIFRNTTAVVRWAAGNWVEYVQWIRGHGLTPFRYEDLVSDPKQQLAAMCCEGELPFQDHMLDHDASHARFGGLGDPGAIRAPRPIDRKSVGHGQELTDEQREIVRTSCEALAKEFGYPR